MRRTPPTKRTSQNDTSANLFSSVLLAFAVASIAAAGCKSDCRDEYDLAVESCKLLHDNPDDADELMRFAVLPDHSARIAPSVKLTSSAITRWPTDIEIIRCVIAVLTQQRSASDADKLFHHIEVPSHIFQV